MTTSRPARLLAATTITMLVLTACTRPEDALPAGDSLPPVPTVETTTTSPAPTTTNPTTTTTMPTTSTTPTTVDLATTIAPTTPAPTTTRPLTSASDLTLVFDAIGPIRFGDRDVIVVPVLTELLGAPTSDVAAEYPVTDEGSFLDESGEQSYISPFGRTVCYANALCVQFGAGAPETLIFTGWRVGDQASSNLATDDGITIGATWAEFTDSIAVEPANSCYWIAYADAGGIDVILLSDEQIFAAYDENGELFLGNPDPTLVTVIQMQAGQFPQFIFDDC